MPIDHENKLDTSQYEFLDFGCSAGGSLERYGRIFGVEKKGLGLDINPDKVNETRRKGYDAEVCDITKIQLSKKIRFGVMHHFLEHIPSMSDVKAITEQACSVIDEFLLIRQPFFDADAYLFSHGYKLYWSDWKGHPNHMTLLEFHNILAPMVDSNKISGFALYGLYPIENSADTSVHNLDSGIDQHEWEEGVHSTKKIMDFTIPIYKEVMAIVDINGDALNKIENIFKPPKKFYEYKNG